MGDGWWQASDGKWYPPQSAPPQAPPPSDASAWGPPGVPGPGVPAGPPAGPPQGQPTGGPLGPPPGVAAGPQPGLDAPAPATVAMSQPMTPVAPKSGTKRKAILAVVAVLALVAGGLVAFAVLGGDSASASEVSLEALGSSGPNPYTAAIAPRPSATLADFAEKGASGAAAVTELAAAGKSKYRAAEGNVAAIYGGTLDESACDGDQLVSFLEAEPEKAAAWASVIEIEPADIAGYVAGLTPANLAVDTRVINYSWAEGKSTPREAVLQHGNAVMVDGRGVPRVNCYSGNPMKEPTNLADNETYLGTRWGAFDAATVVVIRPAGQVISEFEFVDVATGERYRRPAGAIAVTTSTQPRDNSTTKSVVAAGPIVANKTYNGEVSEADPESRYTIEIPDGAVITLRIANRRDSKRAVYAELAASGDVVDQFRVNANAKEEREYLRSDGDGGEYELVFSEGPAAFEFEVGVAVQDDAGQGVDAGDDVATALAVTAGAANAGRIGDNDQMDRFTIQLKPSTELRFTATAARTATRPPYFQLEDLRRQHLLRAGWSGRRRGIQRAARAGRRRAARHPRVRGTGRVLLHRRLRGPERWRHSGRQRGTSSPYLPC